MGAGLRGARPAISRRGLTTMMLPVGAVAVHQLRYWLMFGAHAGRVLDRQGDAYVAAWVPWLIALAGVGLAGLTVALIRSTVTSARPRRRHRLPTLWLAAALLLLAGYVFQESMEELVGDAHLPLFTQAFGDGGWLAVPLSVGFGLLWALLARGAQHVAAIVRRRRDARRRPGTAAGLRSRPLRPATVFLAPRSPLAARRAGRAPPAVA